MAQENVPSPQQHFFGWLKQQPDFRDLKFSPSKEVLAVLPASVDLSSGLDEVLQQGNLGACGPHSADVLIEYDQKKQGLSVGNISRLFTYYTTRQLMGTVNQDSGVDNRSMLKALANAGFCNEVLWPYIIEQYKTRPPESAYASARANLITSYASVAQDLTTMKGTLVSGFPFIFGFSVYQSFESQQASQTGVIPMPLPQERMLGGHDVAIYGYDDATQRFKFRNSWGREWGSQGNGTIPYAYATDRNLSGDFWVINAIPGGVIPPPPPGGDRYKLTQTSTSFLFEKV